MQSWVNRHILIINSQTIFNIDFALSATYITVEIKLNIIDITSVTLWVSWYKD